MQLNTSDGPSSSFTSLVNSWSKSICSGDGKMGCGFWAAREYSSCLVMKPSFSTKFSFPIRFSMSCFSFSLRGTETATDRTQSIPCRTAHGLVCRNEKWKENIVPLPCRLMSVLDNSIIQFILTKNVWEKISIIKCLSGALDPSQTS